jgi:pyridinium-3,5-bisthiocarboxylic acid mononucleotide nickel chelatase
MLDQITDPVAHQDCRPRRSEAPVHIHLDPLGGMAGDMFVAAIVDAFPDYAEPLVETIKKVADVDCRLEHWHDAALSGRRFAVDEASVGLQRRQHTNEKFSHGDTSDKGSVPSGIHHHGTWASTRHPHTHWADIRQRLEKAPIASAVRDAAISIFTHLAEAEGRVHGIAADAVSFHEVGNADSIADIVGAAFLIAELEPVTWSIGPLPLGSGTVSTAHGILPVPAPATSLLLEGFAVFDDDIGGERVTPTGAAILRSLTYRDRTRIKGRLIASGIGYGTRQFHGMANIVRALVCACDTEASQVSGHRQLSVITFEVDDQTPEDMAIALERLRGIQGIHDVLQLAAIGKKGRMTTHVQVLANPDILEGAIEACFHETTTIGLRTHLVEGRALPRLFHGRDIDGVPVRVKSVVRPDGRTTAKTEADDLKHADGQAARTQLRRRAEVDVVDGYD